MKFKITLFTIFICVVAGRLIYFIQGKPSQQEPVDMPHVIAEIGKVVESGLAVGAIEHENEIEIKSKISGVVHTISAQPGESVRAGDPLIEAKPDPTPLELAEAKLALERTRLERVNLAAEMERIVTLLERELFSPQEFDRAEQQFNDVKVREQINKERLELLENGRIVMDDVVIESVIRAPEIGRASSREGVE